MASCGEKSQGDAESCSSMCVVENIFEIDNLSMHINLECMCGLLW